MPPPIVTTFLVLTVILVLLPAEVAAFGAGDIPDFAYLEGKAFRHGDIENTLLELVKAVGHSQGGGLLGFAQNVLSAATGGKKFSKDDVKHVYFGNWLRDYSQAMDIAGLSKLTGDTITLIVGILGFLEFGFATEEYEVTQDRLGVYLPVEHIDNPRGYAEKEGDARRYHQKLRPPVDRRELEVDSRTGMKNYMATEDGGWDTSTAFIRRTLRDCIQKGRNAGGREGPELWETFRLLGQGLHTLEDFTAHSNWVEIALRKLGNSQVFCHVGDNVYVDTPNGRVPPIVTGTFGGADFFHSLLGETTDKISQSSVTDLSAKMSNKNSNAIEGLKDILSKLKAMSGDNDNDGSRVDQAEEMKRKSEAYHFDPNQALPAEVVRNLKEVLKFHDDTMRSIIKKVEMIPGLTDLLDGLSNALNAFVYTTIAPYITPVLTQVTTAIGEGSAAVISSADQWEVFNDPNASDPTHSVLSKDHFGIILNEPAGKVAKVVVEYSVNLIVEAWSNNSNPDDVINRILEAFHHPYYNNGRSEIQNNMIKVVRDWVGGTGQETISCLTKEGVRGGKNKREGESSDGQGSGAGYSGGYSTGTQTGGSYGGSTQQSYSSGGYQQSESGYGGGDGGNKHGASSYGRIDDNSRDNRQSSHSHSDDKNRDNSGRSGNNFGRSDGSSYENTGSGYVRPDSKEQHYGQSDTRSGYGQSGDSRGGNRGGYGGSDNKTYQSTQSTGYGRSGDTHDSSVHDRSYENTQSSYGQRDDGIGQSGYGRSENKPREKPQSSYEGPSDSRGSNRGGYGKSDYDSGSYGSQQEGGTRYGSSGGGYASKRSDEKSYDTSSNRSGYQPSYETPIQSYEGTYSSGNTRSSSNTSGGGYGRGPQVETSYNTPTGNTGGDDPYDGRKGSGYGGESQYGGGHGSKSHHQKHHDSDETYGAERLNLGDDDDDTHRRGYGGGDYSKNQGYGGRR